MADQNDQNPTPLLLFPAGGELAPDAFRPVPATASLFPQEEGEADSFLGQTEPSDQPPQPTSYSFFQQQNTPSSHSDPFANISQSNSQIAPPPPQPSMSTPAMTPPRVSSPPSGFAPAPFSSPSQSPIGQAQPYSPHAPPPTGPSQVRSALSGHGPRSVQHKPMAHPMSGPPPSASLPMMMPSMGPPPSDSYPSQMPQFDPNRPPPTADEFQEISHHQQAAAYGGPTAPGSAYVPIQPHWFYCKNQDKQIWLPFSILDSLRLEEAFNAAQQQPDEHVISTNGGRYDIRLQERMRYAIYWQEKPSQVRRCTWFYKSDEDANKFIPYEEDMCARLEEEFETAILNNIWHRRLEFPGGETIVMHNPNVIVHFRPSVKPDEWGSSPDGQMRPRVVKRGVDDFAMEQGEPTQVDHIVFVVHGIGPVCDMRFRGITECVDDFRSVSLNLLDTHFKHAQDDGRIGRIEFLPVYWYEALHGDATGVDRRLRRITLGSISRLRRFTNDTLLDILFYSSPCYCQQIAEAVGSETNRLLALFKQRNPSFKGQVSMIGHSLGSLIVFDMLSHQKGAESQESAQNDSIVDNTDLPDTSGTLEGDIDNSMNEINEAAEESPELNLEDALAHLGLTEFLPKFHEERIDMESLLLCGESDLKEMGLPLGPRKKLGGFLKENAEKQTRAKSRRRNNDKKRRKEAEERRAQEAAARAAREEQEAREKEEKRTLVPSVSDVSNASLHVDYLTAIEGVGQPTVQYPQLDFKPSCFFAIGSPIGMFVTVRGIGRLGEQYQLPTCQGFFNIFHPFDPVAYRIEPLVNPSLVDIKPVLMPHHKGRKRFHLELKDSLASFGTDLKRGFMESMKKTWSTLHQFALAHRSGPAAEGAASATEVTEEDMEAVAEKLSKEELERQAQEAMKSKELETPSKLDLEMELQLGQLNNGRRIDYVLQEAPFESFNEYLFALGSHACYWESEDTVLMVLREIYALKGVFPILHGPDKKGSSVPPTPH